MCDARDLLRRAAAESLDKVVPAALANPVGLGPIMRAIYDGLHRGQLSFHTQRYLTCVLTVGTDHCVTTQGDLEPSAFRFSENAGCCIHEPPCYGRRALRQARILKYP